MTWDDVPTRARLHTVRDWQRAGIRWWCVAKPLARPRLAVGACRTSSILNYRLNSRFRQLEFSRLGALPIGEPWPDRDASAYPVMPCIWFWVNSFGVHGTGLARNYRAHRNAMVDVAVLWLACW